jgi:hypothetical protein
VFILEQLHDTEYYLASKENVHDGSRNYPKREASVKE